MFGNRVQYRPDSFAEIMARLDELTRE